jgi:hypothetical protein
MAFQMLTRLAASLSSLRQVRSPTARTQYEPAASMTFGRGVGCAGHVALDTRIKRALYT